ncbi:META domain-containing protein [Massilia sp. CFBP9012]|uniref:META domain-containing protein n=1 Tax=Massilia sp. CFBP9012 TaxID=3096531 RepID=UPI002A69CF30|nr:META domain-containing protein [Massilia sp. CFBP9012]MDY0977736.1 META domain-containing protein [Massilia sp. CFBP9012]
MTSSHRINDRLLGALAPVSRVASMGLAGALLSACMSSPADTAGGQKAVLAGSAWNLVSFTSSSDEVGVIKPQAVEQFQVAFGTDGKAAFQFDCNRGTGSFEAVDTAGGNGSLRFGAVATTRAMCPQQAMSARLPGDIEFVRGYRIVGDKLYLSLMADGGIYEWARRP